MAECCACKSSSTRGALPAGWPSEAGIVTSEFKLLLWVAALYMVVCLVVLVLPLEIAEVVEGGDFEGRADGG